MVDLGKLKINGSMAKLKNEWLHGRPGKTENQWLHGMVGLFSDQMYELHVVWFI